MAVEPAQWCDTPVRRDVRDRCAAGPVPGALPLLGPQDLKLLRLWVRDDNASRGRASLLKLAGASGIERAELLCDCLLREGFLSRREHLVRGSWQWQRITWRDLEALKRLLGVGSKSQREAVRQAMLADGTRWAEERRGQAAQEALDPDLLDEVDGALEQLAREAALKPEVLQGRIALLRAVADWHDAGGEGLRRDFALQARGDTKAIGAADWRWLEASFDLERLRIAQFAPMLWLAGALALRWGERQVDVDALHCAGLPLGDVARAESASRASSYWVIENRASFERQAQARQPGQVLLWVPGRPSAAWMDAVAHLLRLAPAPAQVSADADPAGVDIACTVGALWEAQGLRWEPARMGVEEWSATSQKWALNAHDRLLLERLLARADLPPSLRSLCEAMQREGRKAEQEAWL